MLILKRFALLLLLACVALQVLETDCERAQGRRDGKGRRGRAEERPPAAGSGKAYLRGKFSTKDKTQCTWSANEEDPVTLGLVCARGGIGFNCEYSARPETCAPYATNAKAYWKQIARSLKKQKNICQDAAALVKAGMCKKAPRDAHFKLVISEPPFAVQPEQPKQPEHPEQQPEHPEQQPEQQPVHPEQQPEHPEQQPVHPEQQPVHPEQQPEHPEQQPVHPEQQPEQQPVHPEQPEIPKHSEYPEQPKHSERPVHPKQSEDTRQSSADIKSCPDNTDRNKLAEEYCSGSWVTLCNFFFTMVQNEDC